MCVLTGMSLLEFAVNKQHRQVDLIVKSKRWGGSNSKSMAQSQHANTIHVKKSKSRLSKSKFGAWVEQLVIEELREIPLIKMPNLLGILPKMALRQRIFPILCVGKIHSI